LYPVPQKAWGFIHILSFWLDLLKQNSVISQTVCTNENWKIQKLHTIIVQKFLLGLDFPISEYNCSHHMFSSIVNPTTFPTEKLLKKEFQTW